MKPNLTQRFGYALALAGWAMLSSILGTVTATTVTCFTGLAIGTNTWCGLGYFWLFGLPIAAIVSLVVGLPAFAVFQWFRLNRPWQYALGGTVVAMPIWYMLAEPFSSTRWASAGLFDSMNYLGAGAASGLIFYILRGRATGMQT